MGPQESLKIPLDEFRATLRSLLKRLKAQEKATGELGAAIATEDVAQLRRALSVVDPKLLDGFGLGDQAVQLSEQARGRLGNLHAAQRRALTHGLQAACEASGRTFRRLGESPPEYLVAPYTVRVDPESMEATVCYARQDVRTCSGRPEDILAAVKKAEEELTQRQDTPEQTFDRLFTAYRAALGRRAGSIGQRVELAEVLPQMALARQGNRFQEDPRRELFRSYSKARFLYDLARLRSARLLERRNLRLDIGTATGDSVRRKNRVFFLQNGDGEGQYYLSLRFVPLPGGNGS